MSSIDLLGKDLLALVLVVAVGCGDTTGGAGDAGRSDSGAQDAGSLDAGSDAGIGDDDGGEPDARIADAGDDDDGGDGDAGDDPGDADGGAPDSGAPDAGPPDAGPPDAGAPDAGPPATWAAQIRATATGFEWTPTDLARTDAGEYVVVGTARDGTTGGDDGLVLRVSGSGTLVSASRITAAGTDRLHSVVALPGGDVIAVGSSEASLTDGAAWIVRVDRLGAVVWSRRLPVAVTDASGGLLLDVARDAAGGLIAVGDGPSLVYGPDVLIVRFDEDGALTWSGLARTGVGLGTEHGTGVAILADGAPLITGWRATSYNRAFAFRLGAAGAVTWAREIGITMRDIYHSRVTAAASGGFYWATHDSNGFNQVVRRFASDGALTNVLPVGNVESIVRGSLGVLVGAARYRPVEDDHAALVLALEPDLSAQQHAYTVLPPDGGPCHVPAIIAEPEGGGSALVECASVSPSARPLWILRATAAGAVGTCNDPTAHTAIGSPSTPTSLMDPSVSVASLTITPTDPASSVLATTVAVTIDCGAP